MAIQTFSELKQALLAALQPTLERHDFKLVKSKEWFLRKRGGVKDFFLLDFAQYDRLMVKPTIRLRLDEVENIFHRTSGFEKRYQSETPTLAVTLQDLSGNPELFEYYIAGQQDVATAAGQLVADFESVALPYFGQNHDLKRIDELLNSQPNEPCVHYLMEYLRCAHGLIVAKLIGRSDYGELAKLYRDRLQGFSDGFYAPKLAALIADLDELRS